MYDIKSILPDVKPKPVLHMPKMGVGCFFRAEKYKRNGEITYSGPWFKNTVLDVGLDGIAGGRDLRLRDSGSITYYINVGTGTSEPGPSQTGLDSFLASSRSTYGGSSFAYGNGDELAGEPAWKSQQLTFAYSIGSCTGNLTELGLSYSSNSTYFNRQLFRDQVGDPTVIPVQNDEGLRITVKLVIYAPMAVNETAVADFDLNGVTKAATITQLGGGWLTATGRFIMCNLNNNSILKIATDSGSFQSPSSITVAGYTSGNFYRDAEYVWSPGAFTGDWKKIRCFVLTGNTFEPVFEIVMDTAETVVDTEEITMTLRRSWGRV